MQDQRPELIDENSPDGLSDAGRKEFSKFYTESLYGKPENLSETIGDAANLQGAANEQGTPERKAYDVALSKASEFPTGSDISNVRKNALGYMTGEEKFTTPPANVSNLKKDGVLYKVTSGVAVNKRAGAANNQYVSLLNVNDGTTTYLYVDKTGAINVGNNPTGWDRG
jgi:hypothetical protein